MCGSIFQRGEGKKLNQTLVSRAADLAKHIISTSTNKGCPFGWQVTLEVKGESDGLAIAACPSHCLTPVFLPF